MLKVVIQILLITFILVLCYDTVDIWLNQINSKKESELIVVNREIEETTQQVETTTVYETHEFSIWPIALGFSCAFCSVVCHSIFPHKAISFKKEGNKEKSHHTISKVDGSLITYKQEKDELSCNKEIDEKDDPNQRIDILIKDGQYPDHLDIVISQDSSLENNCKIDSSLELNRGEKSIVNVCLPNIFNDDLFPPQSSLDCINNANLSPSTSLDHLDCSNSKNLYSMLLENKSISKMGLPTAYRSIYSEESSMTKHFSKTISEKNSELLSLSSKVIEENGSQGSEDSNDSISVTQGQIIGLLSMLNSEVTRPHVTTNDKSIGVQLLTYCDNDIKNIEKRLESIEYGLRRSEEKTKDWGNRINSAETELVDLHEQMYTIFSKFEEEKKTNYIIVSKVSKDKIFPKETDVFDALGEESDEFMQVTEKMKENLSKNKINEEDRVSTTNAESALTIKDSSDEEIEEVEQSENENKSNDDEENEKAIEDSTEVILSELKQRSIALEALLESKSRSQLGTTYLPKKKIPQLSVPPHIIPPYKRSSFAGTDSKADLRKRRINIKMTHCGNEFFWKNRM